MADHTYNLSRWLSRIGKKGGDVPPIADLVQPVQIVGDASALVQPLFPPTAWSGDTIPAVAGETSFFRIASKSPGGTLIRQMLIRFANPGIITRWGQGTVDVFAAEAGTVAPQSQMQASRLVESEVTFGTATGGPLLPATSPETLFPGLTVHQFHDFAFIEPGSFFWFECALANISYTFDVMLQDLEAGEGSPA